MFYCGVLPGSPETSTTKLMASGFIKHIICLTVRGYLITNSLCTWPAPSGNPHKAAVSYMHLRIIDSPLEIYIYIFFSDPSHARHCTLVGRQLAGLLSHRKLVRWFSVTPAQDRPTQAGSYYSVVHLNELLIHQWKFSWRSDSSLYQSMDVWGGAKTSPSNSVQNFPGAWNTDIELREDLFRDSHYKRGSTLFFGVFSYQILNKRF